ncbi:hypothetical protein VTO42DRAFT_6965 [Malbranchea cinnamomea]
MHFKAIFLSAALAAVAPTFAEGNLGNAIVRNQCHRPIHIWSIADSNQQKSEIVQPGGVYSEQYKTNGNGGGISIKIAYEDSQNDVSQFEYTLAPAEGKVYYDLSNINGYPFQAGGASIIPSDGSCPRVNCPPGVKECKDAYNQPFDDHATKACSDSTDLTLTLCIGGQPGNQKVKRHPRDFHA